MTPKLKWRTSTVNEVRHVVVDELCLADRGVAIRVLECARVVSNGSISARVRATSAKCYAVCVCVCVGGVDDILR